MHEKLKRCRYLLETKLNSIVQCVHASQLLDSIEYSGLEACAICCRINQVDILIVRVRKWRMAQCIQHTATDNGELCEVDSLYPLICYEASGEVCQEILHFVDEAEHVSNMLIISPSKIGTH